MMSLNFGQYQHSMSIVFFRSRVKQNKSRKWLKFQEWISINPYIQPMNLLHIQQKIIMWGYTWGIFTGHTLANNCQLSAGIPDYCTPLQDKRNNWKLEGLIEIEYLKPMQISLIKHNSLSALSTNCLLDKF